MDAAHKRATVQAIKRTEQIGKTREEIQLRSLEAKGAAPEVLKSYRKGIERQAREMQKAGMATRAYAAVMYSVPAQITDIVVSLQGGQLKDLFGGVVPAAKELGASLAGLINPYTAAAAVAGTMAYAWYDAIKASQG